MTGILIEVGAQSFYLQNHASDPHAMRVIDSNGPARSNHEQWVGVSFIRRQPPGWWPNTTGFNIQKAVNRAKS